MSLLSYSYILLLYFPFIKLQTTDIYFDTTTNPPDILETDTILKRPRHLTILGALTNAEHIKILNDTSKYSTEDINLSSASFILNSNPLFTMSQLCDIGNKSHAKIILTGHSIDDNDLTLSAISYVSDFYHIPVLTIASRENIFSDKVNIKI
jgi:hypothetical protein